MNNGVKLKPCPFCGGKAKLFTGTTNNIVPRNGKAYIACTACRVNTAVFIDTGNDGSFIFKAADAWNRRVADKEKDPCSAGTEQESKT